VTHVNTTIIHNTYNVRVTNITETRISYNGGSGGVQARSTPEEAAYANERHTGPVAAQTEHVQMARSNPQLRATVNQGKPAIAATTRPSNFSVGVVGARQAGGEYKPPPPNAGHGAAAPGNPANYTHASQLQPHVAKPPNSGDAELDKRYQQQRENLAGKQTQEHQTLAQQQEREHQQAAQRNYSDAQRQAMEQRHAQETQQLQQRHAVQEQHLEQRQASHQPAPKPESPPPAEKR
jgi:hypothetical protein